MLRPSRSIMLFCSLVGCIGFGLALTSAQDNSSTAPEQTTQPTVTPADPTLYDNFDDPVYDGDLNHTLWAVDALTECQITQGDGVMIFRSGTADYSYCLLTPQQQTDDRLEAVGAFEAKVSIDSDSANGFVTQVLQILTEEIEPGHWSATCGLASANSAPALHFDVTHWSDDPAFENITDLTVDHPAEFDRWYTIRIAVDPLTRAVACYADGALLGSVVPSEVDVLQESLFFRHFKIDRDGNTAPAVSYIDDVRLIPPAAPTLYDNFDDPTHDGSYNQALWVEQNASVACQVDQHDGMLVFTNTALAEGTGCNLSLAQPVQLEDIGGFEARLQMASDHQGEDAGLHLEINASLPGGTEELPRIHWQLQCNLEARLPGELEAVFKLNRYYTDYTTTFELIDSETDVHISAEYDRWYTFRLEIDPDTLTAACYVDGELLGSVVPADAEILQTVRLVRLIAIDRGAHTTATSYVDDVHIIPPDSTARAAP